MSCEKFTKQIDYYTEFNGYNLKILSLELTEITCFWKVHKVKWLYWMIKNRSEHMKGRISLVKSGK